MLFSFLLVGFAKPRDPRVTAIVVPDLGGETIEAATHRRLACHDCVVLFVAKAEHQMRIEVGRDARRSLSDEAALRILDDRMRPLLREGRVDDAVDTGISAIEDALRSQPSSQSSLKASESTIALVLVAAIVVLLVGAAALGASSRSRRRSSGDSGHVPYIDAGSGSSGFSGSGGATSSW